MLNIFAIIWPDESKTKNFPTEFSFEHDPEDLDIGGAVSEFCMQKFGEVPLDYDWEYEAI